MTLMPEMPPVSERDFIKLSKNHMELARQLDTLKIEAPKLHEYAEYVCCCWFNLGMQHLEEAQKVLSVGCARAAYSRAYYAAYNASKAVRYLKSGWVSLKGDDHQRAGPDLPSDLPDVSKWSEIISLLLEHRLRADYDNWSDTFGANSVMPEEAVELAKSFVDAAYIYMKTLGVDL